MTYIVQRRNRFYVVAYDGIDPLTGKERRKWHPVGHDRAEAEAVAARIAQARDGAPSVGTPLTLGTFLTETWLPRKRRHVRATTAYRYAWFVTHYIEPVIGDVRVARVRVDHLEYLYTELATTGGRHGKGLAPKTVIEVHMILRAALDVAMQRELVARNVARDAQLKLPKAGDAVARSWTVAELAAFLDLARSHRLYPPCISLRTPGCVAASSSA